MSFKALQLPGVARLRPYSMAFDFGTNSEIFTSIFCITSHFELRLVYSFKSYLSAHIFLYREQGVFIADVKNFLYHKHHFNNFYKDCATTAKRSAGNSARNPKKPQ
jgi:hypothetical protein